MLTKREKKLMLEAYKAGHIDALCANWSATATEEQLFESWLNEDVAEGGLTVEMLLDHENKEKGNE